MSVERTECQQDISPGDIEEVPVDSPGDDAGAGCQDGRLKFDCLDGGEDGAGVHGCSVGDVEADDAGEGRADFHDQLCYRLTLFDEVLLLQIKIRDEVPREILVKGNEFFRIVAGIGDDVTVVGQVEQRGAAGRCA